ncbi:hypothetical protein NCU09824 [Neurospora crassa OR74A]|uniref:Uncharacterized protein n=1 Tax=Neurospora crassa (strain ATCC 24698 / 74-OR23-1A / CBS 708.71 / DSM 1257 / FGSC 987) TaxID=367110 RepID=V5INM4_NEUCR|nr:hypothetical protein NCU09824 [Neurospora crassa OR74A]ESA42361.1 hypothetical protein NCU09824 [Neurospora crassa OR74A]|eukprot:XP_011394772.1 hypothetical protein NCU09824 [Neurospora crassa OR74A]
MAVLPLPDLGTWLFRRGDADRKRVAAENPVTIVKQLDGYVKELKQANLPHSLKDAEKDALVGAMLLMGKSLQDALNMFMAEVLPHDEYPKGWNEVLSGTLGGLQRALADTLVTLERPHAAEAGLSMKQHQESLKTRTLSLELDEASPQVVKPGLNRSESAPAGSTTTTTATTQREGEISPDFPPLGPPLPLRLAPVPERFEPAYEYRDLAADNPGVSMAVIQELRAEMRVNAAIQLAIESLEFTEGQLQLMKQVDRAAGGADFEPVQQHFYEGYDRILRRAVELERRHASSEVPVAVSQPLPRGDNQNHQNRPQTSHTQNSAQLSPTSWRPRPPRRISLVTIPPPHEAEAHSRGGGGGGQRQSSYTQQKRPGTAPNGGMMHRKRSIMFNDDGDFSDYASTLGNSRSYSNLRSSQGSHGSRGSMEAMTMSPTGQAFDQRARANVRRSTVHGMVGMGIREEETDERPQHSRGLSQSQQLDPPTLRRRLSLADELAMASNTDSDSSNYGDEDNDDYYQEDGDGGGGGEEEDEEFGEFGEVGEASVIQSELGSGSDRGLASPRTPGSAVGPGPGGFVRGMVHGGLMAAAAAGGNNNNNMMNLNDSIHSRGSSLDSIPMSEGLVGQIPPSEYGSQFDEGSTYGGGRGYGGGYGGGGYGATHSRQVSSVNIDDRISYVPSTWGNVSAVEEGMEEEEEEEEEGQQRQQQYEQEGNEENEEIRSLGGRRLSGYFPGAGRYDGEYDDDRDYGDEEEHDDTDEQEEEKGHRYADEDAGMDGGGDDHDRSEASADENEELTEIIEQLRPYMMLGGAASSNTGRVSA